MSILKKDFLSHFINPAPQRDLMLGRLVQFIKHEGVSQNTRRTMISLAMQYPNDQCVQYCLLHTLSYIDAYYGKAAAYSIAQEISSTDNGHYSRVRNMATRRAEELVLGMALENRAVYQSADMATASAEAISICERFMTAKLEYPLMTREHGQPQYHAEASVQPVKNHNFFHKLRY
jgi:hypothetical protein